MQILFPEQRVHRLALATAAQRSDRGSLVAADACADLAEPMVTVLRPENITDDPELRRYLEQHRNVFRFDSVCFAFGFSGPHSPKVERATLSVRLTGKPEDTPSPIALSMAPLRLSDKIKDEFGVSFELRLNAGVLELSTGLEGGEEVEREQLFASAHGLGQSKARWEYCRTPARSLQGMFRAIMILRSERAMIPMGTVELSAVINERRYIIFDQESPLGEPTALTFSGPAVSD